MVQNGLMSPSLCSSACSQHQRLRFFSRVLQFLLLELDDETFAVILPLIDRQTYRGTLRPPR
jgi:hypothetical protein